MNDNKDSEVDLNQEDNRNDNKTSERLQNISRRGFNTLTNGKWDKVRNAPIIGNAAKKVEQKAADKLGNTKLGQKIASPDNHKRPNLGVPAKENKDDAQNVNSTPTPQTKKNDVGSQNLQNSLRNKAKNLINRRKKGNSSSENGESSDDSKNESAEKSSDSTEDRDDSGNILSPEEKIRIKRRTK